MSASTKKKHVINEILDRECRVHENQQLVKVIAARGNHLYEVQNVEGEQFLASMPSKFRNTVWIRPGSFVIIEFVNGIGKVKGQIVNVLLKHHVKLMKKDKSWPVEFGSEEEEKMAHENSLPSSASEQSEDEI